MKAVEKHSPLVLLWLLMVLSGCAEVFDESRTYGTITFGTQEIDVSSTRALIDQDAIDAGGVPVFVHGIMNGSTRLYPVSSSSQGEQLTQETTTAKWLPNNENNYKDWVAGNNYSFTSYAYTPSTATSSMLDIEGYGKRVTINQPSTYDHNLMVDYMLSHTFTVADGRMRPVVELDLEHAMTLVEVRVVKHESIAEAYIESVEMSGFFRGATMNCTAPANYNSGNTNKWTVDLLGNPDTVYSIEGGEPTDEANRLPMKLRNEEGCVTLYFLAIPQQMEKNHTLSVSFWVNERFDEGSEDNFVRHEATFQLYNYTPIVWSPAHRVVYTLEVDTGIRLLGTIAPWVDVDYIEGTVLPEIKY